MSVALLGRRMRNYRRRRLRLKLVSSLARGGKILDGDTMEIMTADKVRLRIRLNRIDAAEKGQPCATKAKQVLSDKIGGEMMRVG